MISITHIPMEMIDRTEVRHLNPLSLDVNQYNEIAQYPDGSKVIIGDYCYELGTGEYEELELYCLGKIKYQ